MDSIIKSFNESMRKRIDEAAKNMSLQSLDDDSIVRSIATVEEYFERESDEDLKLWTVYINCRKLITVDSEFLALSIMRNFSEAGSLI